jgi:hypothetical protein
MSNTKAAALNRAFNNANATVAAQAATLADLAADQIAAANKFDVATLTNAELAKQVMTNMGFLPSTVAAITQLEIELAAYFGGMGKGNRGFVVLQLSDILSGLTADATYGAIATAWNTEVAASVVATVPGTSALTTAATDNLVGSSGDDIFTAITSALAALTLNGADKIAAGDGVDTLKVDVAASFAGLTSGTITGLEKLELTNKTSDKVQFDARSIAGVTDITLNSTVPGNFADASTTVFALPNVGTGLKNLVINGSTSTGTLTLTHASGAAEITGTTDAIAVTVNGLGSSSTNTTTTAPGSFTLRLDDYETANVTASGANVVTFANNTGTTLKTLNIAGSGSITVSAVANGLTTFDASTSTGAVTATLTAPTTSLFKKIATGSAVDAVTVDTADLAGNATIDLGLGADTLTMSSPAGATAEYNMTGVETIALGAVGATLTLSGAKTTGLTKVTTSSTSSALTAATVDLVSIGSGALTVESTGATNESGDVNSDNSGAATVTLKASSTAITAKTQELTAADYVFSEATGALTFNVGAFLDTQSTNVTANKATSLVVDVTGAKGSDGITERTSLGGIITANKATSVTVTNTGTLGSTANISAPVATTVSVTNGSVGGAIDLDVVKATSLSLTTGSALALTGSTFTVLESLTVSNNAGAVSAIPNLVKAYSVTANGAGASSAVTLGDIGAADVASNATVTATGQKLGFTLGNIATATGYNTTVTTDSVGGAVSIGNIGAAATSGVVNVSAKAVGGNVSVGTVTASGAVTINAAGTVGTVGVAAVSSPTGAVNIDASSVTGIVTLSTVAGKSVVVNLADSAATSTVAGITARDSANITFNSLTANGTAGSPKTIVAATASTALDVTLKGGVLSDNITVTGKSTNTSIKVAGDLGASTDSIVVEGLAATTAQTIDISGLINYDGSTLSGGSAVDTIIGGAGADDIRGRAGADILTGGAGIDRFMFDIGQSSYASFDTITDLQTTDRVLYNSTTTALSANVTAVDGAYTAATPGRATIASGIATFDSTTLASNKDSLVEVVGLVANAVPSEGQSVLFSYGGATYLFIDGGTTLTDSVVVQLTGVNINALALAMTTTGTTGLSGFGL